MKFLYFFLYVYAKSFLQFYKRNNTFLTNNNNNNEHILNSNRIFKCELILKHLIAFLLCSSRKEKLKHNKSYIKIIHGFLINI